MAQWTVEGAKKATGEDVILLVEAPSAEAARQAVAGQGVVVSGVTPSEQHLTAAPPADVSAQLAYQALVAASGPPLRPIRWAALALLVVAIMLYLLGLLELVAMFRGTTAVGLSAPSATMYIASNLYGAVKTFMLGVGFQTAAALLPLVADRLARPRP